MASRAHSSVGARTAGRRDPACPVRRHRTRHGAAGGRELSADPRRGGPGGYHRSLGRLDPEPAPRRVRPVPLGPARRRTGCRFRFACRFHRPVRHRHGPATPGGLRGVAVRATRGRRDRLATQSCHCLCVRARGILRRRQCGDRSCVVARLRCRRRRRHRPSGAYGGSPVCRREARWSDGASPSLPLLGAA